MSQDKTITLSRPIQVRGKATDKLVLKEPTVDQFEVLNEVILDMKASGMNPDGTPRGGQMKISNLGSLAKAGLEHLTDLTPDEARQVAACDLMGIAMEVQDFFMPSPEIGKTALPSAPTPSNGGQKTTTG